MLNYITSEIYRSSKSITMNILLMAGIFIPAIMGFIYSINTYTIGDITYLTFMSSIMPAGSIVLGIVIMIVIYKSREIYSLILSQGVSIFKLVVYEYLTYMSIIILLSLLLVLVCIIVEFFVSLNLGYEFLKDINVFLDAYIWLLLGQISVSSFIFGFSFLTKSVGFGVLITFLLSLLTPLLNAITINPINPLVLRYFQPLNVFIESTSTIGLIQSYWLPLVFHILGGIYIGYLGFRKREF